MLRRLLPSAHSDTRITKRAGSSGRNMAVSGSECSATSKSVRSDEPLLLRRSKSFTHRNEVGGDVSQEIEFNSTELSIDPFDTVSTLKRSKSMLFLTDRSFVGNIKKTVKSVRFTPEVGPLPDIHETPEQANESGSSNYDLNNISIDDQQNVTTLFKTIAEYKLYDNSFQKAFEITDSLEEANEQENMNSVVDVLEDDLWWFDKVSDNNNRLKLDKLKLDFNDLENSNDNHMPTVIKENILDELESSEVIVPGPPLDLDVNLVNSGRTLTSCPENSDDASEDGSFFPLGITDQGTQSPVEQHFPPSSAGSLPQHEDVLKIVNVDTTNSDITDVENYASNEALIDSLLRGLTSFDSSIECGDNVPLVASILKEIMCNLDIPYTSLLGKVIDSLRAIANRSKTLKSSLEQRMLEYDQLSAQLNDSEFVIDLLKSHNEKKLQDSGKKVKSLEDENGSLNTRISDKENALQNLLFANSELKDTSQRLQSELLTKSIKEENSDKFVNEICKLLFNESEVHFQQTVEFKSSIILQVVTDLINDKQESHDQYLQTFAQNKELEEKIRSLESSTKDRSEELVKISQQYNELQTIHNINQTNHELIDEGLNIHIKNLKAKVNDLSDLILDKEHCINKLESEICNDRATILQLEKDNQDLYNEKSRLERERTEKACVVKQLQNLEIDLKSKLEKSIPFEKLYTELSSEFHILKLLSSKYEIDLEQSKQLNYNLKAEISQKSDLIVELTVSKAELHDLVSTITQEKFEIISNNNYYISKYNEQMTSIDDIMGKLKETTNQMNHLKSENNILKESHVVILKYHYDLLYSSKQSLKPLMYEESVNYFESILHSFKSIDTFLGRHHTILSELNVFIVKALSDLVTNYMENESILEEELINKQTEYTKMLNELSGIMIKKLNLSEKHPLQPKEPRPSKMMPNYLNESYKRKEQS